MFLAERNFGFSLQSVFSFWSGMFVCCLSKKSKLSLENIDDNEYKSLLTSSHEPQSVFVILKWRGPKTVREVKRQTNSSTQTAFPSCMPLPPPPPPQQFWGSSLKKWILSTGKSKKINWFFNQLSRLPIHISYYKKIVILQLLTI